MEEEKKTGNMTLVEMNISDKFQLLTRLPLMQGLGGKDLAYIEETLGLHVNKCTAMPLAVQGDLCRDLTFVTDGLVTREHDTEDGRIRTISCLQTPMAIEPECLYGISCLYAASYRAQPGAGIIRIGKRDVNLLVDRYEIFRLNYMNALCSALHRERLRRDPCREKDAREKLLALLRKAFEGCTGGAQVIAKMTDLADRIGETRLNASKALNALQDEGVLRLTRGRLLIDDVGRLRM